MEGDDLGLDTFPGVPLGRLKERMPLRFTRYAKPPPHLAITAGSRFGAAGVPASLVLELERFDQLRCAVSLHAHLSRDERHRSASLTAREYDASFRTIMNELLVCAGRGAKPKSMENAAL